MADRRVLEVDAGRVSALKQQACAGGRNLAELLAAMPEGGNDTDFARAADSEEAPNESQQINEHS